MQLLTNAVGLFRLYNEQRDLQRRSLIDAVLAALATPEAQRWVNAQGLLEVNVIEKRASHYLGERRYFEGTEPLKILALGVEGAYSPRGFIKYEHLNDQDLQATAATVEGILWDIDYEEATRDKEEKEDKLARGL